MGEFILLVVWETIAVKFKLQPSLPKQDLEHDKYYEDSWEDEEYECLPYVENDAISSAFSYARYTMGMKNSSIWFEDQFNITVFSQ